MFRSLTYLLSIHHIDKYRLMFLRNDLFHTHTVSFLVQLAHSATFWCQTDISSGARFLQGRLRCFWWKHNLPPPLHYLKAAIPNHATLAGLLLFILDLYCLLMYLTISNQERNNKIFVYFQLYCLLISLYQNISQKMLQC